MYNIFSNSSIILCIPDRFDTMSMAWNAHASCSQSSSLVHGLFRTESPNPWLHPNNSFYYHHYSLNKLVLKIKV